VSATVRTGILAGGLALVAIGTGCGASAPPKPVAAPAGAVPAAAASSDRPNAVAAPKPTEEEAALIAKLERMSSELGRAAFGGRATNPPVPTGPHRPRINPLPLRIAELPVAQVPAPLPNAQVPVTGSALGDVPSDIAINGKQPPNQYASLPLKANNPLTNIHVGPWPEGGMPAQSGNWVQCIPAAYPGTPLPMRWESVSASGEDELEYVVSDGWFDQRACRPYVIRRTTVKAHAIVPGLLYGFRQCTGSGSGECNQQSLTLLFPPAGAFVASGTGSDPENEAGLFGRTTIPLVRGGGLSFQAQLPFYQVVAWRRALDPQYKGPESGIDVIVGVEITQDVEEREPIAVRYIAGANPSLGSEALSFDEFEPRIKRSK
jgi:hypothetical protein